MLQNPKTPTRDSKPPGEVSPWALAGLGTQFVAAILFFVYAGNWIDRRLNSSPLFLLGGVLIGGGGTFFLSYRRLMASANATTPDNDSTPKT